MTSISRPALLCLALLACGTAQAQPARPVSEHQTQLALFFDPQVAKDPKAPAGAASGAAPTRQPIQRDGQRIDDRRPEEPFTVSPFGQPVQLTGSWEYTDEQRRNFDLERARERDRRVREHEIKLEARTRPSADSEVFVQAVGLHETRRTQGSTGSTKAKSLERGQTWVRFDRVGGSRWSLQAGRVPLIDRRAWWWDDDLDALRVTGAGDGWKLDSGLARELMRVSSAERGSRRARAACCAGSARRAGASRRGMRWTCSGWCTATARRVRRWAPPRSTRTPPTRAT